MAPLTFLITAGPTIEDIDPVRFISNRATGKLGVALSVSVVRAGHAVILIHGPVHDSVLASVQNLTRVKRIAVRSAADMHRAVMANVSRCDVLIMNAAVADYTPAATSVLKLKKTDQTLTLKLKSTVDILQALGALKKRPLLIGFALETGTGNTAAQRKKSRLSEALRKMESKNLDAIVLDTPAAMGGDVSDFELLSGHCRPQTFKKMSKRDFAEKLVRFSLQLAALEASLDSIQAQRRRS